MLFLVCVFQSTSDIWETFKLDLWRLSSVFIYTILPIPTFILRKENVKVLAANRHANANVKCVKQYEVGQTVFPTNVYS